MQGCWRRSPGHYENSMNSCVYYCCTDGCCTEDGLLCAEALLSGIFSGCSRTAALGSFPWPAAAFSRPSNTDLFAATAPRGVCLTALGAPREHRGVGGAGARFALALVGGSRTEVWDWDTAAERLRTCWDFERVDACVVVVVKPVVSLQSLSSVRPSFSGGGEGLGRAVLSAESSELSSAPPCFDASTATNRNGKRVTVCAGRTEN